MRNLLIAVLVLIAAAASHAAAETSKPAQLRIMAGGQAFEGPPVMTIRVDETAIAEIAVGNAIDSLTVDRPPADKIDVYMQAYDVDLPSLATVQRLRIEFNNDAWAGPDKRGDRNLWIASVTVGDRRFEASQLTIDNGSGRLAGTYVSVIMNGGVEIIRPPEGWQVAAATEATACNTRTDLVLTAYAVNQIDPGPEDAARVRALLGGKAGSSLCRVMITGSTSPGGGKQVNERIAKRRAEAVAVILRGAGIPADRIEITAPATGRRAVMLNAQP